MTLPLTDSDGLFSGLAPTDDHLEEWYQQQIGRYGTQAFLQREDYNFDILKRLSKYGVPAVSHDVTWQAIITLVLQDKRDDVLQYLLTLKIAMKVEGTDVLTTVLDGNLYLTNLLLEQGADVNQRYPDGDNLLMKACKLGYLEIIRCLLKWKAQDNYFNAKGDNALLTVCKSGNLELVQLLALNPAALNAHSATGPTALVYACRANNPELVDTLLLANADPFVKCKEGDAFKAATNPHITTMLKAFIGLHEAPRRKVSRREVSRRKVSRRRK